MAAKTGEKADKVDKKIRKDKKEKKEKKEKTKEQKQEKAASAAFSLLADEKAVNTTLSSLFATKVCYGHACDCCECDALTLYSRHHPSDKSLRPNPSPSQNPRTKRKRKTAMPSSANSTRSWTTMPRWRPQIQMLG